MLHTLIKALEVKELSPGWICSFISLHKPAGRAVGTRWEQPPRARRRVLERALAGAWVSGRSRAQVLAPSSHPCIPGHTPVGDALYQHRQLIHAQFKSLFAFKNSSVTPLLSRPVAVGQRVAGNRRWGAARVQDLPSALGEPGLNWGDRIPRAPDRPALRPRLIGRDGEAAPGRWGWQIKTPEY